MRSRNLIVLLLSTLCVLPPSPSTAQSDAVVELCLEGELDLGVRLQGTRPEAGELSAATWCVVTEGASERVYFRAAGRSNPDMTGEFAVSYLPPDIVRIVNRQSPPDVEFRGGSITAEALRYRRIDPFRLVEELERHPEWRRSGADDRWQTVRYPGSPVDVRLRIEDGRLEELRTSADLPLRGTVPVHWLWDWPPEGGPTLALRVDGELLFRANAAWRTLTDDEAAVVWRPSAGRAPREAPSDAWPARVDMQLDTLADGVYVARGVRTGFHHLVIDTEAGLVVGDAPAGWVELPQIPPADLVPGLGVSGLSERLIDFLGAQLPGRPVRAVALTHAHDDHAGGARAFAAAGADVYAPAEVSEFLTAALNRSEMPADRLSALGDRLEVRPVTDRIVLPDPSTGATLIALGPGPHGSASLGLWATEQGFFFQSDLHVPNTVSGTPRADRAATECWFAEWAVATLPPETIVVSSHTLVHTPVSRLAQYLETAACRGRQSASRKSGRRPFEDRLPVR
jgi:glyoxylase-like metal-dependent hydrolase (beta-lactamase superfamily II)